MNHPQHGWRVELRAKSADKLEFVIHDTIGQTMFEGGVTSAAFLAALRAAPDARAIDLRVNSAGGILDDAKGMVNLLLERAAAGVKITAYVDGLAASAASYLLTAAHRVVMPENTFLMLHGARGGARGDAKDFEDYALLLRRTNEQLATDYAAASQRRGVNKTAADYLAMFAAGDTYLDADEAIAIGLADEKTAGLKVAASLVDLGDLAPSAPRLLTEALYVSTAHTVVSKQPELPAAEASSKKEIPNMKLAIMALGLAESADESAIVAQITKLKASARVGSEVESLVGALGDQAIGAVRALKQGQDQMVELNAEVQKLKAHNARNSLDALLDKGLSASNPKERKLTPAVAKRYRDQFDVAIAASEDPQRVVNDLEGFLAVAPRLHAGLIPVPSSGGEGSKAFEAMSATERHTLKQESPELYDALRADAVVRRAI